MTPALWIERGIVNTEVHVVESSAASAAELATCYRIRRIVFVEEQGVSREEEFDDLDAVCVHFLAHRDGEAVGTARMHPQSDAGKAQRVAVLSQARRCGVGAELMLAIETEAHDRGLSQVVLHAQASAIPFYESIGYRAEGEEFVEADIPHRFMRKVLAPHHPDAGSTASKRGSRPA
ncbi:MAG: GNAT family N-acetyltransferase [Myxococcota bacterium]